MSPRQRFLQIASGARKGDLFLPFNLNYAWFMDETLERWRREGLPADVDLCEHFGFQKIGFMGGAPYSLIPAFEEVVLAEDAETRTVRDGSGVTYRIFKQDGASKMPQWLDYSVKSREDWNALKKRLDPTSPERYAGLLETSPGDVGRDYPLGFAPGSFFGHTLQKWVGTERLCLWFYDEPALVEEMLDYLEFFFLELAGRFLGKIDFDFASFGEDIAYKGRAFLSPAMFRRFLQPHYIRICERMRASGIETIFVDSDGYIDELIPLWMQVGVNAFSPLEVAAGEDAAKLKREYGDAIVLAGNVDKRLLARGRKAIDGEVARIKPILDEGGYFPAVDHSVPPDVSYDDFRYFLDKLRA
jgi:uroporphyrinogen decarboxylase